MTTISIYLILMKMLDTNLHFRYRGNNDHHFFICLSCQLLKQIIWRQGNCKFESFFGRRYWTWALACTATVVKCWLMLWVCWNIIFRLLSVWTMKLGVILCSLLALIQVSEAAVQCPDYRTHFKQNRIIGGVSARFLLEKYFFLYI